jgi:hypothetical protein
VAVGADAVEAQQLAGHLEARHLVAAVFRRDAGLEETRAHRVQRRKGVAHMEQRLSPGHGTARRHNVVKPLELLIGDADRQAQLAQVAARTRHLERLEAKGSGRRGLHDGGLLPQYGACQRDTGRGTARMAP